jgi:amidohydrolase
MEEFVQFRRHLHKHPETSGKEFETTRLIREVAIRHGVREDQIRLLPETGLWIDLAGEAEPQGKDVCIALRADIDALEMNEAN